VGAGALYFKPLGRGAVELSVIPYLRVYNWGSETNIIGFGLNRPYAYDPDDPAHGDPDVLVSIPPTKEIIHIDIPVRLNYTFSPAERFSFVAGISRNFGLNTVQNGTLDVITYGQKYHGEFNVRSGYWGIDVGCKLQLSKTND
jgi:hypothetical protein